MGGIEIVKRSLRPKSTARFLAGVAVGVVLGTTIGALAATPAPWAAFSRAEKVAYVSGVGDGIIATNKIDLNAKRMGPYIVNCREIDTAVDKIDRLSTRADFMSNLLKLIVDVLVECGGG